MTGRNFGNARALDLEAQRREVAARLCKAREASMRDPIDMALMRRVLELERLLERLAVQALQAGAKA